jgi:hypothetical protein
MKRFYSTLLIICSIIIFHSSKSVAIVSILNMSENPQTFIISEQTNQQAEITIEAGQTWQSYTPQLYISHKNNPDNQLIGRDWDTFAYWPNGDFGIQFRRRRSGRY